MALQGVNKIILYVLCISFSVKLFLRKYPSNRTKGLRYTEHKLYDLYVLIRDLLTVQKINREARRYVA
jgi:hypothetical protein